MPLHSGYTCSQESLYHGDSTIEQVFRVRVLIWNGWGVEGGGGGAAKAQSFCNVQNRQRGTERARERERERR